MTVFPFPFLVSSLSPPHILSDLFFAKNGSKNKVSKYWDRKEGEERREGNGKTVNPGLTKQVQAFGVWGECSFSDSSEMCSKVSVRE